VGFLDVGTCGPPSTAFLNIVDKRCQDSGEPCQRFTLFQ